MRRVYLDNGATTKVDEGVARVIQEYMVDKFGNPSSLHEFGREAKNALDRSRRVIAAKINANSDEIIFTSGGTEADNLAIRGVAYANKDKNHIITSKIEHHAVLNTCKQLEKEGFRVTYLDVDGGGFVDLEQLKNAIDEKTALVSIMHANNEIGTIEPIEEISRICKEKNILFHTDAVQSFTKVPINVKKMGIDLLSLSAHKIHGPKGMGALYIREGVKTNKMLYGGHQENDLRAGTENVPGIVGFAKAVEISNDKDIKRMTKIRDKLINAVFERIPDVLLNGSKEKRLCNNADFSFKYVEGESLLLYLDSRGIAVSTGSACSSKSLKPSHVLTAIGLKPEIAHGSLRFTLSKETTEEDIDYVIGHLVETIGYFRKMSPLVK